MLVTTRCLGLWALTFAMFTAGAGTAFAAPCGTTDPVTQEPLRGALKLDERSVTTQAFKRSEDPRTLLLIYAVEGCELRGDVTAPSIDTLPRTGATDIPAGVLRLLRTGVDARELALRVSIDTDRFDPGSYGGMVEVRAPYLSTTRTPVSISRSEPSPLLPAAIGAVVGLVGVLWFLGLQAAGGRKLHLTTHKWLALAGLAGAVAGAFAVLATWLDQDVWTVGENWLASVGIAATGATTGAMAVLLRAITGGEEPSPATPGRSAARSAADGPPAPAPRVPSGR